VPATAAGGLAAYQSNRSQRRVRLPPVRRERQDAGLSDERIGRESPAQKVAGVEEA